ncbi:conserved hypothetical protein [Desulfamplus magnetovallimortis]|uniref:Uncharacterized protein n=1 Tax=Desulfamplus magnetovallimortis TaxID=1246637 RepID=A0A1W1HKQ0_9BACT|nr:conserved hypothetical protein [Desulfamplus magnetovallimortis]
MTFSDLARLKRRIDDLMLPYEVDIVDYNSIENCDLKDHIDRVGKKFF